MVRAWFMDDDTDSDQRLEHHRNPPEFLDLTTLYKLTGVEYFKVSRKSNIKWKTFFECLRSVHAAVHTYLLATFDKEATGREFDQNAFLMHFLESTFPIFRQDSLTFLRKTGLGVGDITPQSAYLFVEQTELRTRFLIRCAPFAPFISKELMGTDAINISLCSLCSCETTRIC